ncbi:hypothetical protein NW761_000616 [Fusarium oxysporum]|uniref:Uncharacterized protein n=3 Tax=Fusarium oxysporum TaxID=5507 RepID=A0A2H3T4V1_FUSOX|nr:hypothetical protein FOTG_00431 [Fusarium oxysporum f. sp. vasinfectum 25433]KAG6981524.1 hypothetical protein FocnCong_v008819 [Fusarium oxysporum f. sp. conglutinans]KAG7435412.1 hypothetical protein Forpi1262_v002753 [Fusarium oxysporum f. sp. raphani]KAI8414857.1 hypothetical protein FOFC_04476 [Fusarium oxysporum]KAK2679385.1 hypothetical protein RAB80_004566 [Fusarium oxysporum f. sp. vasinfectum]
MAPSDTNNRATKPPASGSSSGDADLAQAYRDLARGEQAATALENNLSNLESRLDAILAALEAREPPQMPATAAKANSSPGAADKDQKGRSLDGANGDAEKIEKDAT